MARFATWPDRRAGSILALQDRRSLVPQLDRPGDGLAGPANFRLSALQQEFQPVVLRTRSLGRRACCEVLARPSATRTPDDPLSGRGADAARPFSRAAGGGPVQVCRRLPRLRRGLPDGRHQRRRTMAFVSTWVVACFAPTARKPVPRAPSTTRRITAWPRGRGKTWSCKARRLKLARGSGREVAPPLRPVAEAPAGECRRLQRLRSRPERAQHRRLRPGPVRHPVRRLPASRRRPRCDRAGHREHANRRSWKPTRPFPPPKLVIAVGACAISGGPYVDNPEVHNGCDSLLPVDLYIPGCPPHPLTILHGLLKLLGKL